MKKEDICPLCKDNGSFEYHNFLKELIKSKVGPDFYWSEEEIHRWRSTQYTLLQNKIREFLYNQEG